jgi:hypothetical protein
MVTCWDNCFDASTLALIRSAGEARSHGFTSVFDRLAYDYVPRSPLESAIVSLLEQIEKDEGLVFEQQRFVEYWWRDKVRMLEAHRDVDEEYCRKVQTPLSLGSDQKVGEQRCPFFGHVLYVDIVSGGTDGDIKKTMQAPTLVWEEEGKSGGTGAPRRLQKLWSVPAVTNRLLRFRGDCFHAVCHPPLAFLDTSEAAPTTRDLLRNPDDKSRRAVLLFNTWKDPPLFPAVGEALVAGENYDSEIDVLTSNLQFQHCPVEDDKTLNTINPNRVKLSVPLLGGISRRGCQEASLESFVDETSALRALTSEGSVHRLTLYAASRFEQEV